MTEYKLVVVGGKEDGRRCVGSCSEYGGQLSVFPHGMEGACSDKWCYVT